MLDTCVLAPMPVMDTLLRLAEEPAFYIPKWSPYILDELRRTLVKMRQSPEKIERRIRTMTQAFPEALVDGFDDLIPSMRNDEKDRHVLAAAVKCSANSIVSDNRRHFPPEALQPYGLECKTAEHFLVDQYHLDPDTFIDVINQQAEDTKSTPAHLISRLGPSLSDLIKTDGVL
jgi:hypothetical protein